MSFDLEKAIKVKKDNGTMLLCYAYCKLCDYKCAAQF